MISNLEKMPDWKIVQSGWEPKQNRFSESIFSLANEYMGLRAFFEENYSGDSLKGTYVAGIYYPDKTRVGWWKNGYPEFFAKILNSMNWVGIEIILNDNDLDIANTRYVVSEFTRELDMKKGRYSRSFIVTDEKGFKTKIEFERFVSMSNRHVGCVKIIVTALNYSGNILLRPYIEGNVKNEDANYDDVFWNRVTEELVPYPMVVMETKKTFFEQACSMKCKCKKNEEKIIAKMSKIKDRRVEQEYEITIEKGSIVTLEKIICITTSRDDILGDLKNDNIEKMTKIIEQGYDNLMYMHNSAMKELWKRYDVKIEGDKEAQKALRYNIFELMTTYNGNDDRLNIGPKGFTGEKYGGTTYWDTEAFCLPFYLYSNEKVAKNLLIYRYKHLEMAKENAKKLGLKGALYPMVTVDGQECHNEWEITFEEIHRNGAIAYAIYNYTEYTKDTKYLEEYGLEVLIELSRFWSSRVTYNKKKDCYMILGVTGPNEYENNVNNNFYTNTIAAWTLEYTLSCLQKYSSLINPLDSEIENWKDIVSKMYYPYVDELEVFEQNDLYMDKELVPANMIDEMERPINQHWSWNRVLRSCYIKQADVVQSLYFFPNKYDIGEQRRNFDFYEPMTVHESSLSPSIYSIVASRIGYKDKAYELYRRTSRLDLENINNDTGEGLHITSMGASWAAVIQGFAGVKIVGDNLVMEPAMPKEWSGLSFNLVFRKSKIHIKISRSKIKIFVENEQLKITVNGETYFIEDGEKKIIKI